MMINIQPCSRDGMMWYNAKCQPGALQKSVGRSAANGRHGKPSKTVLIPSIRITRSHFPLLLLGSLLSAIATAEERTLTPEEMEKLAKTGELAEEVEERPAKLPDLTQGDPVPTGKATPQTWHLGPTGIVAMMMGGFPGDQLLVRGTLKGSPAEGKFLPGDVITGMNGKKFTTGGHLGILIGNTIIEAEKEENAGKITFQFWRDANYGIRAGKQDVTYTDIDKMFNEAKDDNSLYDWKSEEDRKEEVAKMNYEKFPILPSTHEVELKLRVFPAYSDTAPYDCPKTRQILEEAWKVLENRFVADPKDPRSGKGGAIEALALIASGKPEHREIVKQWVRSEKCPWRPPTEPIGAPFEPGYKGYMGYQSWHMGSNGLDCALYYDATGDEYVLPALRKFAVDTAMGQSKAGTWGHTFAYPSMNGGELHQMNPGYGALNAAGNRCFFLITLARKLGIQHPEIDLAVERAHRFFGSYVDQGAIPYGDHPAAATDDSNGKNTGIAFAMKLLGDKHGAKYFAMMSSHCAFTRRGGHGHDYHGNWSSWAANLCGPTVRAYNERNLRWRRTLCRLHDGSFVYHSPTSYRRKALRDPTATEVLHQSVIFQQTLITGKDADESLYPNEREMNHLIASARFQFNDPWLESLGGKPWPERSTAELFELLDTFMPKTRAAIATELGKRFQAGETDIAPKLTNLLTSEEPRFRQGALLGLQACGTDTVLGALSQLIPLLDDPRDFVRITAVQVISKATENSDTQMAMLKATAAGQKTEAPNSFFNAIQDGLFGGKTELGKAPFAAGLDEGLVERALADALLEETGGGPLVKSHMATWDKDTVVRLAGPLTYLAEEEQVVDQMFGSRNAEAQAMLGKFGYREALQTSAYRVKKKAAITRTVRPFARYKDPLLIPNVVLKQPALFREFIEPLKTILTDNPVEAVNSKGDKGYPVHLGLLLELIEAENEPVTLPSIADEARRLFQEKLDAATSSEAKLQLCRDTLKNPDSMFVFRMMAAMDFLTASLGADALPDLAPYLGHSYWRLREHSRKLAAGLMPQGAQALAGLFPQTKDAATAAGILDTLATDNTNTGLDLAKQAMSHPSPLVRTAAVKATFALGGTRLLPEILAHLQKYESREERAGCEDALLSRIDDPSHSTRLRDAAIAAIPDSKPHALPSLYYLLSRIGDAKSIAELKNLAQSKKDPAEFDQVIFALSYSPSRAADDVMLELASADERYAKLVGQHAVRRMVIGPKGYGDVSNTHRMDFAETMVRLALDDRIITYLGYVHEARALRILMYCLQKGKSNAAESLIRNAEGLRKLSPADTDIAVQSLKDVIEYIEITHLRGGPMAHSDVSDRYPMWKSLQARAGKTLIKLRKPEKDPIRGFDPLELKE
jgi:hypothetical protein